MVKNITNSRYVLKKQVLNHFIFTRSNGEALDQVLRGRPAYENAPEDVQALLAIGGLQLVPLADQGEGIDLSKKDKTEDVVFMGD